MKWHLRDLIYNNSLINLIKTSLYLGLNKIQDKYVRFNLIIPFVADTVGGMMIKTLLAATDRADWKGKCHEISIYNMRTIVYPFYSNR